MRIMAKAELISRIFLLLALMLSSNLVFADPPYHNHNNGNYNNGNYYSGYYGGSNGYYGGSNWIANGWNNREAARHIQRDAKKEARRHQRFEQQDARWHQREQMHQQYYNY